MQPGEESVFDRSTVSAPSSRPALPKLYRGRPWLAALAAVLTELVVIGGVDNQAVTKTLRHPLNDPARVVADYSRGAIDAATTFGWRFAPAGGQATHVWAAQFAAIGALVVLTWLGALAIARGSVTFGRVWIGIWALVAAVTPIAIMVRNVLVTRTAPGPAQSRIGQSVYGFDAFGPVIVAGLALGFVAGLIAAAVAVSDRRQIAAAAPARDTGEQDEYYDDSFSPRYSSPPLYEPRPWGEAQWQPPAQDVTTQLPRYASDEHRYVQDEPTVATPSVPSAPPVALPSEPTAALPVMPTPPQPDVAPPASAESSAPSLPADTGPTATGPTAAEQSAAEPTQQPPAPEPVYGLPADLRREPRQPDADATQAIPVQRAESDATQAIPVQRAESDATQAIPVQRAESDATQAIPVQRAAPDQSPSAEPSPGRGPQAVASEAAAPDGARELVDEEVLADELAVAEHTQELPRITDENEHPRN